MTPVLFVSGIVLFVLLSVFIQLAVFKWRYERKKAAEREEAARAKAARDKAARRKAGEDAPPAGPPPSDGA